MCCYSSICRWGCPSKEVNSRISQSLCGHEQLAVAIPPNPLPPLPPAPKCDFGHIQEISRESCRSLMLLYGTRFDVPKWGVGGCGFSWHTPSQRHCAHPSGPVTVTSCVDHAMQTDLLIWQLLPREVCKWESHPKIIIILHTSSSGLGKKAKLN